MKRLLTIGLFTLLCVLLHAQGESLAFNKQNFALQPIQNSVQSAINKVQFPAAVWLQFEQNLSESERSSLSARGAELISFIGKRTYLFYLQNSSMISQSGASAFRVVDVTMRSDFNLFMENINPESMVGNKVRVLVDLYKKEQVNEFVTALQQKNLFYTQPNKDIAYLEVDVPIEGLQNFLENENIRWIEAWAGPSLKDDTEGRGLHRSNSLDSRMPNGRNYSGLGVGVLVRDDGIVGPHIDFQGRLDNSLANTVGQTHGDGVAGIMAGAGNLDPQKRGMAAGSEVYVSNYQANFLDNATTTLINNGSVQITNSSYSDGCNGGYTSNAQRVDLQMNSNDHLLHVFSAGNSNNQNCGYGAGNQWGNITGGHKQGKNVIATANVFYDGALVSSSSRGPAHDGRIKPDIAANGQNQLSTDENNQYLTFGGTSGAAPGIAGISAQLYEAYMNLNNGDFPNNALIKAVLLNSANDAGNPGPDFRFGWGIVNGLRAAKCIEEGRYLSGSIGQGGTQTHTVTVPSGTKELRIMVYWSDPAASPGATTALVNDIDMVVVDPSTNSHLPWVLNPAPNATTLNNNATTGADHLNNMEQVLLSNPAAGIYSVNLSGYDIPVGPQEYWVVYEVIGSNIEVTYPNLGESFKPNTTETIHWDATGITGNVTLEYSTNNGTAWNNIATVNADVTNYDWQVPSTITGQGRIRVSAGSISDLSDSTFSIASVPVNLNIIEVCPDSAQFMWNAVPNAEFYDLYLLGNQYMEIVGTSTSPTVRVPIPNANAPLWYAVRARNVTQNWTSERTLAKYYAGGILNCQLPNDLSVSQILSTNQSFSTACGGDNLVKAKIFNPGIQSQSNFTINYRIDLGAPVSEVYTGTLSNGQSIDYTFLQTVSPGLSDGPHILKVYTSLGNDDNIFNDTLTLNFTKISQAVATPFVDNFNGALPSAGWTLENPDGQTTWTSANVTGINGQSSQCWYLNHFSYTQTNQEDILVSTLYSLPSSHAKLSFDLAKAQYSANFMDNLKIEISNNCGNTYTPIYTPSSSQLQTTAGFVTGNFVPTANQWRVESVDLSAFNGQTVQFRITAINGYGNGTYIDNFNITSTAGINVLELNNVTLHPNPAQSHTSIRFGTVYQDVNIKVFNQTGQAVLDYTSDNPTDLVNLEVGHLSRGMYLIQVQTNEGMTVLKMSKE